MIVCGILGVSPSPHPLTSFPALENKHKYQQQVGGSERNDMPVEKGDKVKVEYIGTLDDGTVFDKSGGWDGEDDSCDCENDCDCEKGEEHEHDDECGCGCDCGPLAFIAGVGQVISGFDEAVLGMEVGEEKTVHIDAENAYGPPNPDMIQQVPKDQFPPESGIEEGMQFLIELPDGNRMPVRAVEIGDDHITLDLNHPLAGQALNFKLKVVGIEPGEKDE